MTVTCNWYFHKHFTLFLVIAPAPLLLSVVTQSYLLRDDDKLGH